jgi:hypothetical protein
MQPVIPLDKMSTQEKLRAIEEIWADLERTPEAVPSPDWHGEVLREREEKLRRGEEKFIDWPEAKRRIREQTR